MQQYALQRIIEERMAKVGAYRRSVLSEMDYEAAAKLYELVADGRVHYVKMEFEKRFAPYPDRREQHTYRMFVSESRIYEQPSFCRDPFATEYDRLPTRSVVSMLIRRFLDAWMSWVRGGNVTRFE